MSRLKENVLLRLVFPVADFIMNTKVIAWYRQIEKMESWSNTEIERWQLERLQRLLLHAYCHTVYYREVFDRLRISPQDIKSMADLKRLPILTKTIVRERFDDLIPDNINEMKHRNASTGGSTGEPFKYLIDENTWGFTTAIKIYSWKKTGYRYGDKFLSLGSSSLFPVNKKSMVHKLYYRLKNTIPQNAMNMDDDVCEKCVKIIKKQRVKYIYGYASAVYLLAQYCKRTSQNLTINGVFTTSEKLTSEYRELIETTWHLRVMDCYGARDGGVTAYEITPGCFHVGYSTFCETEQLECASELYCTNLIDYAFPLIRYQIGDEVILDTSSSCHDYNGQVLTKIIGRTSDIIHLGNGCRLTTSGFNSMFRDFNVKAFRIVKKSDYELAVQLQKGAGFKEEEKNLIVDTMKKHAGNDIEIHIEYVKGFQPLPNGKRSFFMNDAE